MLTMPGYADIGFFFFHLRLPPTHFKKTNQDLLFF